jgi:ribosomal protein L37E
MFQCHLCGGPALLLGRLGDREHYQCRDCGIAWSRRDPRCAVCGDPLGWDRPSGVCSEECLGKGAGE